MPRATTKDLLAKIAALEARLARLEAAPAPVIHQHSHYEQAPPVMVPYAYPRPWWETNQITCGGTIATMADQPTAGGAFWRIPQSAIDG